MFVTLFKTDPSVVDIILSMLKKYSSLSVLICFMTSEVSSTFGFPISVCFKSSFEEATDDIVDDFDDVSVDGVDDDIYCIAGTRGVVEKVVASTSLAFVESEIETTLLLVFVLLLSSPYVFIKDAFYLFNFVFNLFVMFSYNARNLMLNSICL